MEGLQAALQSSKSPPLRGQRHTSHHRLLSHPRRRKTRAHEHIHGTDALIYICIHKIHFYKYTLYSLVRENVLTGARFVVDEAVGTWVCVCVRACACASLGDQTCLGCQNSLVCAKVAVKTRPTAAPGPLGPQESSCPTQSPTKVVSRTRTP